MKKITATIIFSLTIIFTYSQKIDSIHYGGNWDKFRYLSYPEFTKQCNNSTSKTTIEYLFYNLDFEISLVDFFKENNFELYKAIKDSFNIDKLCNSNCTYNGYNCLMLKFNKIEILCEYFKDLYNYNIDLKGYEKEIVKIKNEMIDSINDLRQQELKFNELENEKIIANINKKYNLDSLEKTYAKDSSLIKLNNIKSKYQSQILKVEEERDKKISMISINDTETRIKISSSYLQIINTIEEKMNSEVFVLLFSTNTIDYSEYTKMHNELESSLEDQAIEQERILNEINEKYNSIIYDSYFDRSSIQKVSKKYGLTNKLQNIYDTYNTKNANLNLRKNNIAIEIQQEEIIIDKHKEIINLYFYKGDKNNIIYNAYYEYFNLYFEKHEINYTKIKELQDKLITISNPNINKLLKLINKEELLENKINIILSWENK